MSRLAVAAVLAVAAAAVLFSPAGGGEQPNVVLISIEATEAEKLPCYGYRRNTTPNLCGFAENATVYTRAYTASTYTPLSIASISTGRYPFEIGMYTGHSILRERFSTLAERLSSEGYVTYGLHAGNPQLMPPEKGIIQGYERFSGNGSSIAELLEQSNRPVFVRKHINGPHHPYDMDVDGRYEPRYVEDVKRDWLEEARRTSDRDAVNKTVEKYLQDAYDDNLRATDIHVLGPMLHRLQESPEFDDTVVIITADHGHTEPGDYGPIEDRRRQLNVPLIIHYPGKPASRDGRLASTVDLMPTVLDFLGMEYSQGNITGLSLLGEETHDYVFASDVSYRAVMNSTHILLKCRMRNGCSSDYALVGDGESGNRTRAEMRKVLESKMNESHLTQLSIETRDVELKAETRERLKELGYIS